MCISELDKKPKQHDHGYKIFIKDHSLLKTTMQNQSRRYKMGNTYDAKGTDADLPVHFGYPLGFHYYLKFKDAKIMARIKEMEVVRVNIQNILATGIQENYLNGRIIYHHCGVSEFITLDKEMYRYKEVTPKDFLNICKGEMASKILDFIRKYATSIYPPTPEWNTLAKLVAASEENYTHYFLLIDCFFRKSKCFKTMTAFHIWAISNNKKYEKRYLHVVKVPGKSSWKVTDFILSQCQKLNLDEIILGK